VEKEWLSITWATEQINRACETLVVEKVLAYVCRIEGDAGS
jgi:hypothetical protein